MSLLKPVLKAVHLNLVDTLLLFKSYRKPFRHVRNYEKIIKPFVSLSSNTVALDLGCGRFPLNPFHATKLIGADSNPSLHPSIVCVNLTTGYIPFDSNTFDYCTAFDLLEHIPRYVAFGKGEQSRYPFIELINEIHRILKPNGLFFHRTPAYPSLKCFQDPTHVNFITENSFPDYFCEPKVWARTHGYGFSGSFQLVDQAWIDKDWLVGLMKCVK